MNFHNYNIVEYQQNKKTKPFAIHISEVKPLLKYPDDCIRHTSWNICSLGDSRKRKNIYNKINRSPSNLFLLQVGGTMGTIKILNKSFSLYLGF